MSGTDIDMCDQLKEERKEGALRDVPTRAVRCPGLTARVVRLGEAVLRKQHAEQLKTLQGTCFA